jgi:hypothetical protein
MWNADSDYEGPWVHRIRCTSGWSTCYGSHETAAEVKDCWRKERARRADPEILFVCNWLVPHYTEDGPSSRDCGALAKVTDRGFECESGHEHVSMSVQFAEGWTYAEADEAGSLLRAGVGVRLMDGTPVAV